MRADIYLFQYEYVKSRQKAKSLILSQNVKIDGRVIDKPSFEIEESIEHIVEIFNDCPYVSRGGLKLEAIIQHAKLDVNGKVCLDIGASSGGFTDCLLKNGAVKVFAVDSGTNQLDVSLRNNQRVVSYENLNARFLNKELFKTLVDIVTIDVSFVSQTLIMPSAFSLINDNGLYVSLIKPQFEAGRQNVGKGGIVKDKKARLIAVMRVIECAEHLSYKCTHFIKSPIQGGDGNTEYLAVFSKNGRVISKEVIKELI